MNKHVRTHSIKQALGLNEMPELDTSSYISQMLYTFHRIPPVNRYLRGLWSEKHQFRRVFGIAVEEFALVFHELDTYVHSNAADSYFMNSVSRCSLSLPEQFAIWLLFMQGNKWPFIASNFNHVSEKTVRQCASRMNKVINNCYAAEIRWPNHEERQSLKGSLPICSEAICIADGSHFTIRRPKHHQKQYWSGHKRKHSLNYLFVVDAYSFIIMLEGPWKGRRNDRGCWNSSNLGQNPALFLDERDCVLVDGGFIGQGQLMFQYTKKELQKARTDRELQSARSFNEQFALDRTTVEHVIGSIKTCFPVLGGRFPLSRSMQPGTVRAAANIYNRIRRAKFVQSVSLLV